MNIVDDKLVFNDSDILTFTPFAQKALAFYSGTGVPPETTLITVFNAQVDAAKAAYAIEAAKPFAALGLSYAIVDQPTRDEAKALIDQAKAILGVPPQAPEAVKTK